MANYVFNAKNVKWLVQKQVVSLRLAQEGHSFLLTGQAGTGKTAVVKEIVKCLRHWYTLCISFISCFEWCVL